MSVNKRDVVIGAFIVAQCGVLGVVWAMKSRPARLPEPEKLSLSAQEVIGDKRPLLGAADAPYTLVEFGDYQCPPCAARFAEVERLLPRYPTKLRFQFRHYPLIQIHPFARQAALIAEEQRIKGRFWATHRVLYAMDAHLSPSELNRFKTPDVRQAEAVLQQDIRIAEKIGIAGTPTFLLCSSDGTVLRIQSLDQVPAQLH
ncbi:MAG: Protein-disulfide isomerase [Chthonomonadales bacterium]|nr:Protein-disulfide isomerase [Chthonomonadales bacterium]